MRKPIGDRGFTLLEVMISVAIISIALVTLLTVFNRTTVTSTDASILTRAVMLGGEKLARSEVEKSTTTSKSEWEEDERYPRFKYKTTSTDTGLGGIFLVQLAVEYNGKGVVTLENYVQP